MVGVLDIDITYGLNLAPSGFRKVCANDGAPRALHTTKDGQTSSYLWYSLATGFNEKCITDMLVIYDDETAPHGFDIFPKNITKGSNHRTFIAIARNPKHGKRVMSVYSPASASLTSPVPLQLPYARSRSSCRRRAPSTWSSSRAVSVETQACVWASLEHPAPPLQSLSSGQCPLRCPLRVCSTAPP